MADALNPFNLLLRITPRSDGPGVESNVEVSYPDASTVPTPPVSFSIPWNFSVMKDLTLIAAIGVGIATHLGAFPSEPVVPPAPAPVDPVPVTPVVPDPVPPVAPVVPPTSLYSDHGKAFAPALLDAYSEGLDATAESLESGGTLADAIASGRNVFENTKNTSAQPLGRDVTRIVVPGGEPKTPADREKLIGLFRQWAIGVRSFK